MLMENFSEMNECIYKGIKVACIVAAVLEKFARN